MAYNDNSCAASKGNTGVSDCLDDLQYDFILIHTPTSYEIDTEANARLEATWVDDIDAKNISPFPAFEAVEDTSEDDVVEELPSGVRIQTREGKYGGTGTLRVALCNLAALRTYNNLKGRAFIVTSDGTIWGTSPDGVKFRGFLLSEFKVGKLRNTDGTTARMVPINYQFKDPTEMGDFPATIKPSTWSATALAGLKNVVVSVVGTATANEVVVSVVGECDAVNIEGLVEADFTILNVALAEQLPADTFTDNGDGTYTFDFTTPLSADTYTVNLKTPALQTTGGYESTGSDSFVIS